MAVRPIRESRIVMDEKTRMEGGCKMREIKFRAWCESVSTMIFEYVDGVNTFGELRVTSFHSSAYGETVPKLKLMQYTGLKDKNGVEIYEGDIIRHTKVSYTDCSRVEIEEVSAPVIGSFYYAEGLYPGMQFEDGTGSLFWPGTIDPEEFEVIGNIHNNPELLEVKP